MRERNYDYPPRAFTDAEHDEMVRLFREGKSVKEIGYALNRTYGSIHGRMKYTDDDGKFISRARVMLTTTAKPTFKPVEEPSANPDRKERPCLICLRMFISESWENRRCRACAKKVAWSEVLFDEDYVTLGL